MSRLVVVSNRLPAARGGEAGEPLPAGGLVSALLDAFASRAAGLWVGWSPKAARGTTVTARTHGVDLVGVGLAHAEVEGFYDGFCNRALWPILHALPGRAELDRDECATYFAVQKRFADALVPRLLPDDQIWIHDYHLIALGDELRRRGFAGRIGFFLHTPFPPADLWELLPEADRLLGAFDAYDLVGFQTARDLGNFAAGRERRAALAPAAAPARRPSGDAGVFPVGIDPRAFEPSLAAARRKRESGYLAQLVGPRRVVLGVDRLDYTKGLLERFRAFAAFLARHPEARRNVCLVQIASPSREGLTWYKRERRTLEELVGRINGEFAEVDWTPIRYLRRSLPRETLARIYRGAEVALVTPLRDGMNLVAKEFVASQRPRDPGVLVLSRFAGAAERLDDALLVNPWIVEETADAIAHALAMPLEERRERHARLLAEVREATAARWAASFLAALAGSRRPLQRVGVPS